MTKYMSVTATQKIEVTFDVEVDEDFDIEEKEEEANRLAEEFLFNRYTEPDEVNTDFDFVFGDWEIQEIS